MQLVLSVITLEAAREQPGEGGLSGENYIYMCSSSRVYVYIIIIIIIKESVLVCRSCVHEAFII